MKSNCRECPQTYMDWDLELAGAETALKRAALKARERAWQAGHGVIVMVDGQIVELRQDGARPISPARTEETTNK